MLKPIKFTLIIPMLMYESISFVIVMLINQSFILIQTNPYNGMP